MSTSDKFTTEHPTRKAGSNARCRYTISFGLVPLTLVLLLLVWPVNYRDTIAESSPWPRSRKEGRTKLIKSTPCSVDYKIPSSISLLFTGSAFCLQFVSLSILCMVTWKSTQFHGLTPLQCTETVCKPSHIAVLGHTAATY